MEGVDGTCVICLDKPKNILLLPCKHLIGCLDCVNQLKGVCPIDRKEFTSTMTVYNV